jgi:hypothetical protein
LPAGFHIDTARAGLLAVSTVTSRPEHASQRPRAVVPVLLVALLAARAAWAEEECLVAVKTANAVVADDATVCATAENKACLFQLQLCVNEADGSCAAAPMKKKVKAKGRCAGAGKLRIKPAGIGPLCGGTVGVKVKTKKKGKREGKCVVRVRAKSIDKPARKDVDRFTLVCKPNPGECPPTGGGSTTTTTLPQACITSCECCVLPISELAGCVSR